MKCVEELAALCGPHDFYSRAPQFKTRLISTFGSEVSQLPTKDFTYIGFGQIILENNRLWHFVGSHLLAHVRDDLIFGKRLSLIHI